VAWWRGLARRRRPPLSPAATGFSD
jgi:hypothetical protein